MALNLASGLSSTAHSWPTSIADAPNQVVREVQQVVADRLPKGRREVHGLQGRRVGVEANGDAQPLVEHELVKALHSASRKAPCVTVAIHDRPENILKWITFYDPDSKPIDTRLSGSQKQRYLREIKKDVTYSNRSYRRTDLHAEIDSLGVEASAELIETLVMKHRG